MNLVANDLDYDERSKRLYASLPGAAGPHGNSLVSIDPVTGALGTPAPIGSEPNRLALSDDGRYLYVALEGESGIRRYDIGRGVVDAEIALVAGANTGPCFATDLAVVPGQAEMIAVAQGCKSGGAATSSVFAYAGTTPLPAAATTGQASGAIAFCGDSPTLYSYAGTQTMRVEAGASSPLARSGSR